MNKEAGAQWVPPIKTKFNVFILTVSVCISFSDIFSLVSLSSKDDLSVFLVSLSVLLIYFLLVFIYSLMPKLRIDADLIYFTWLRKVSQIAPAQSADAKLFNHFLPHFWTEFIPNSTIAEHQAKIAGGFWVDSIVTTRKNGKKIYMNKYMNHGNYIR